MENNNNIFHRHVLPATQNDTEAAHLQLARLAGTFSRKLVLTPEKSQVLLCLTNAISNFTRRVRWRYYHYLNKTETDPNSSTQTNLNSSTINIDDNSHYENPIGLGSQQKLPAKNPPPASINIESFLKRIQIEILNNIREHPLETSPEDKEASKILARLRGLKNEILLASDKTNKFVGLKLYEYENMMETQLSKNAILTERGTISSAIESLTKFINENSGKFCKKEIEFMLKGVSMSGVPECFGIIKDHKDIPDLRLIIPASSSFTYNFKKVLTKGIENLLSKNKVILTKVINNSYDLKKKISELNLSENQNSIFSLDIIGMYPSIGPDLVREALIWHASKFCFDSEDLATMNFILESFKVVSNFSFIRFQEKFYTYVGKDVNNPGLSMGDVESALFSDIVVNFIYHKLTEMGVFDGFIFAQSYRDDGFVITNSKMSEKEISSWKTNLFDPAASTLTNGKINFTVDFYSEEEGLNYLDLNLKFGKGGKLDFSVYTKKSTRLNYLNSGSLHHPKQIKNVAPGAIKRLARLTSHEKNETFKLHQKFPAYSEALLRAGLISQNEAEIDRNFDDFNTDSKNKSKWDSRKIPFILEYCRPWLKEPIHSIIKRNLKIYHLSSFIRFSMVYKKFSNFAELIKADMRRKVNDLVEDENYQNRTCNCQGGVCQLTDKQCRKSAVTYGITCNIEKCGKLYVGSTQNFAKDRIGQHMGDIRKVLKGEEILKDEGKEWRGKVCLDSFTKHILSHDRSWLPEGRLPSRKDVREVTLSHVIQNCGAFMLGTDKCTICKWEKFWIWSKKNTMNARTELFACCPHKPKLMKPALKPTSH